MGYRTEGCYRIPYAISITIDTVMSSDDLERSCTLNCITGMCVCVCVCARATEPITKISLKIDPYYQRQKCS